MSSFHFKNPDLPRLVTLAFGGVCVGLMGLVGLVMLASANGRVDEVAQTEHLIARAAAVTNSGGGEFSERTFFPGETPQLAQAAVQTSLQSLAEAHRVEIEMIRADQIEQIDGVVRLNLAVNGIAPEVELGAFLHGLAAMRPFVIVEDLTLRVARVSRSNPERRIVFNASLYGTQRP